MLRKSLRRQIEDAYQTVRESDAFLICLVGACTKTESFLFFKMLVPFTCTCIVLIVILESCFIFSGFIFPFLQYSLSLNSVLFSVALPFLAVHNVHVHVLVELPIRAAA